MKKGPLRNRSGPLLFARCPARWSGRGGGSRLHREVLASLPMTKNRYAQKDEDDGKLANKSEKRARVCHVQ